MCPFNCPINVAESQRSVNPAGSLVLHWRELHRLTTQLRQWSQSGGSQQVFRFFVGRRSAFTSNVGILIGSGNALQWISQQTVAVRTPPKKCPYRFQIDVPSPCPGSGLCQSSEPLFHLVSLNAGQRLETTFSTNLLDQLPSLPDLSFCKTFCFPRGTVRIKVPGKRFATVAE
jgi:hypothetical protein